MSLVTRRLFSLRTVWTAVAILLPVCATFLVRSQALDLAYQVRAGEEMLTMKGILRTDIFTYTVAGEPWLNQQWGAQVLLALGFRAGGWVALDALRGACVGSSAWFVFRACVQRGAPARLAAVLTIGGWLVAAPVLAQLRPQLLGTVAFCATLWLLTTRRGHPTRLWAIPAIVAVWANVHGSFPLVFLLIALAALQDRADDPAGARRLAWIGLTSAVATMLNPFGPRVWSYVVDLATDPVIAERIGEWAPPSIASTTGVLFFVSLVAAVLIVGLLRRRVALADLIAFLVFAGMALFAVRAVVWWALSMPVLLAGVLRPDVDLVHEEERSPLGVGVVVALAAFALVAFAAGRGTDARSGGPAMLSFAPEHLVEALRGAVPPGSNVFASQLHTSWAEFSAPDLLYAVDSRVELFPGTVWNEYFRVSDAQEDWADILERDDVDALLLDPDQAVGLLEALPDAQGWRLAADNQDGAVYVRR